MDAWWPRLIRAQFRPALGGNVYAHVAGSLADDPNRTQHLGSAFDTSAYGIVQKDLRDLLGAPVRGPYSRVYCGHGKLGKCRAALLASLGNALKHDGDSELYPDGAVPAGNRETIVKQIAGRARTINHYAAQDLDARLLAFDRHLAPCAGKR